MGSYGIGISRLVGAIIEAYHDDRGILWPTSVAPFQVGIINLGKNDEKCKKTSENIYQELRQNNYNVSFEKFNGGHKISIDYLKKIQHIING